MRTSLKGILVWNSYPLSYLQREALQTVKGKRWRCKDTNTIRFQNKTTAGSHLYRGNAETASKPNDSQLQNISSPVLSTTWHALPRAGGSLLTRAPVSSPMEIQKNWEHQWGFYVLEMYSLFPIPFFKVHSSAGMLDEVF